MCRSSVLYKKMHLHTSTLRCKQVFQSPVANTVPCAVLWIRDYWGWCYRLEIALLATAGGCLLRSLCETDHKSVWRRPHWKLIDRLTEELVTWRCCTAWSNQFNMRASLHLKLMKLGPHPIHDYLQFSFWSINVCYRCENGMKNQVKVVWHIIH